MANCKFCNANIPDDSTFCPFCGKQMPLEAAQSAPVNQTPAAEEKPKKKKKKGGIIAAIIALLLVAGIGVTGFIFIDEIKELLGIETNIDEEEEEETTDEEEDDDDREDEEETSSLLEEETKVVTDVATTAPVEVGLGNDILAGEIEIDGHIYTLPCKVSDFTANGFAVNGAGLYVDPEYYATIYLCNGTKTVNATIEPAANTLIEDGIVIAVELYSGIPAELPGGIIMDAVYDGTDGGINWDALSADEYQSAYSLTSGNVNVVVHTDAYDGKVTHIYYAAS